jgi:hypothetical protein
MSKHNLSYAENLYAGRGFFPPAYHVNERHGCPIQLLTKCALGAPVTANATSLVNSATSTNLPNNATKTYLATADGTAPLNATTRMAVISGTVPMADGSWPVVWQVDVPRNLVCTVTHNSSIVACTCTVIGYDVWGEKMAETYTITATGTSKTVTGKKAFAYILSISITSAGNATTNTLTLGSGNVLGLPYALQSTDDLIQLMTAGVSDLANATIVAADATSPATATTGDTRGSIVSTTVPDGTKTYVAWVYVGKANTATGLSGVAQFTG